MPTFIPATINSPLKCGQHYTKGSLRPGKYVYDAGMCLGLTLVWLKGTHVGHPWTRVPTRMEGTLVQHIYAYNNSTRTHARNNWNAAQERALFEEAVHTHSPGEWMQDPELMKCCHLYGFAPTYQGELTAFRMMCLMEDLRTVGTRAFLLAAGGHAIGLVRRGAEIAVFDSNDGITVFTVAEALENAKLLPHLNKQLVGATFPYFAVLELAF